MRGSIALLVLLLLGLSVSPLSGQVPNVPSEGGLASASAQMTPDRFALSFLTLTYDERSTGVRFSATQRLPGAKGKANVEHNRGVTEIEIELDDMKPAWSFGGDFNTYLLWAVSPEGHLDNLGEFVLSGDRSKLNASTRMETFGLIVTAEPHFMVEQPSPFVVLMNRDPGTSMRRPSQLVQLDMTHLDPQYRFERESLENEPQARGEVSTAMRQAYVAVQLAEAAGAARVAPDEFQSAQISLYRTEGAAETRSPSDPDVERMARRTVGLAAAAQKIATAGNGLTSQVRR